MITVLLAIDETPQSAQAARTAHRLFGDAEYLAVNVAATPLAWPAVGATAYGGVISYPVASLADERTDEELAANARRIADEGAAEAGVPDAEVIGEVGDPVTAIVRAAEEHAADVIVVCAHDKGWWKRLIDGSVSEGVLRESRCPVLVVKAEPDSVAPAAEAAV